MTFAEFVQKCKNYPLIRSNQFPLITENPGVLRRQVTEWLQKKWLLELKRGIYVIADQSRRCKASNLPLANYLVTPSYVSLETALSHYRLIPERVEAITCITSKKNAALYKSTRTFYLSSCQAIILHSLHRGA